jgi:hypothetical protein
VRGGGGSNTVRILGDDTALDLSNPLIVVEQFQTLDLTGSINQSITFDAATVTNMAPIDNQIMVLLNDGDALQFTDLADWTLDPASIVDDTFLQTAVHQVSNSIINVNPASLWQNFLRPSDVNRDHQVSTLDALLIINEIARRAYSDPITSVLFDPVATGNFPELYFDRSGNGVISTLDALQILNDLARSSGEGESIEIFAAPFASFPALQASPASHLQVSQPHRVAKAPEASSTAQAFPQAFQGNHRKDDRTVSVDQLLADACFMDDLKAE